METFAKCNKYLFCFRAIVYWRSKNHENMLKGYKMSLQTAIGSKLPASVLNFYFKYTYCRKVRDISPLALSCLLSCQFILPESLLPYQTLPYLVFSLC